MPEEASNPADTAPAQHAAGTPVGISTIADGAVRELDPRWVHLSRRRRGIGAAVLALMTLPAPLATAALGGLRATTLAGSLAWLAGVLLLAWHAWSWPAVEHRHSSYVLAPDGLEIRRGVLFRSVINVPRSRVQHTDVSQGPIERSYGLGRLVVFTAGSSFARVELHGLDHQTALRIRDFLMGDQGGDAV